jgi:hypothetical protein
MEDQSAAAQGQPGPHPVVAGRGADPPMTVVATENTDSRRTVS